MHDICASLLSYFFTILFLTLTNALHGFQIVPSQCWIYIIHALMDVLMIIRMELKTKK